MKLVFCAFGILFFAFVASANICPPMLSMNDVYQLHESGDFYFQERRFQYASKSDIAEILPGKWSPSWLTAQANLRKEEKIQETVVCQYGYKSIAGVMGSKVGQAIGKDKEDMDQAYDYRFQIYHQTQESVPEKTAEGAAKPEPSPLVVGNQILVAVLIQREPSMEDLLKVLGLVNNTKIGRFILTQQYKMKKEWKKEDAAELAKIESAYARLNALFDAAGNN